MIPTKEDTFTEFKTSFSEEVVVSLVAFANAKGGEVYIGVNDKGNVVGVDLGKESVAKWINEIKHKTEPSIIPDADVLEENGKHIVLLSVQEYPVKPVSTRGRYYRRQLNSNHLLSLDEIANLHLQTRNSSWDFYTDPKHTISDIDMDLVQEVIDRMNRRGMRIFDSLESFLRKKELCDDSGQLTYGAYLLFKKREDITTTIELGRFQDEYGIVIKDSLRSKSNIIIQVEEVMSFVKKHINMAVVISPNQVENIQRWDYPLEAIREIVLNMIVHRDYRSAADSVVKILPDKMEFFNPGELPYGLTVEKLMSNDYSSQPRNKQIADIFKDLGEIEKYGSGIRRVCNMFVEAGFEKPQWETTSGGIRVTVSRIVHSDKKSNGDSSNVAENVADNVANVAENVANVAENVANVAENVADVAENERRDAIVLFIKDNPQVSRREIAERFGVSKKTIERDLVALRDKVKHYGPAKGGYWQVEQ